MAALLDTNGQQFCGGTLITPYTILTAGHCVVDGETGKPNDPTSLRVAVGRTDLSDRNEGQERGVSEIVVHPQFDLYGAAMGYDIAMLFLEQPVTGIEPIGLPTPGTDALLRPGSLGTVIGWGMTNQATGSIPDHLHQVDVPIVQQDECIGSAEGYFVTETELCAGISGKGTCYGDSGGPLFKEVNGRVIQLGIVSHMSVPGICAYQGLPGIYTSLSSKVLWDTFYEGRRQE